MITFRQFITEGALQKANLNKNPDRVEKLISKLQNREPFVLKNQTKPTLIIDVDPSWLGDLQKTRILKTDYIPDINGEKIPLNTLQKTTEFGSTGRKGTEKETIQLNRLGKLIKEAGDGDPINIKIGNRLYKNCIGAKNTPGTPKSDFEIIDINNRSVIFISHKDGSKANDFGQWSGMTDYVNTYPEVANFVVDVRTRVKRKMPPRTTFSRKIRSIKLKNKACFGKDFGSNMYGINNVTCIMQGTIELTPVGNYYILEADNVWLNGETPGDDYEPMLMAIYKGKSRRDFQIEGARFSIYPRGGRRHVNI
jgi:hypothetical protein